MSEWAESALSNLVSFQKGRKVATVEYRSNGFEPYLGAEVISGGSPTEFAKPKDGVNADEKDVLMLWDGERSGLVGRGQKGIVSSTSARLSPREGIDSEFLCFALDNRFQWIQGRRTGTGVPHVPKDLGRILRVLYPVRLREQRCIAEILSTVDEAIEGTEKLIAKHQQIKAGLMHDLFTRGLTPDGKLRPPHTECPDLYKDSPLGPIPKEWEHRTVDELLADTANPIRSGPFGSALLKEELVEEGVPLLGIDNVFTERFVNEFQRFVAWQKYQELHRYAVLPGDVIITIMGTVGRCCLVPDELGPALSSKHLWTMTFDTDRVLPVLVCWQINHAPWVRSWFGKHAQGAVMSAIQSSTLRTLTLPVPKLAEQERMCERYSSITAQIRSEEEQQAKLELVKRGLMHDLLTGKVEVPLAKDPGGTA